MPLRLRVCPLLQRRFHEKGGVLEPPELLLDDCFRPICPNVLFDAPIVRVRGDPRELEPLVTSTDHRLVLGPMDLEGISTLLGDDPTEGVLGPAQELPNPIPTGGEGLSPARPVLRPILYERCDPRR